MRLFLSLYSICSLFGTLLLSTNLNAQVTPNNYDSEWSKIDSLINQNLTRSAYDAAKALYETINKDTQNPVQDAQAIKTLLHIKTYMQQLEENGSEKSVAYLEQATEEATGVRQALLRSLLASSYNDYLKRNLYKIQNRTTVSDFSPEDVATWTASQLTQKCFDLYQASLTAPNLKTTSLENFEALIVSTKEGQQLCPTLYDFLVSEALEFFKSGHYHLTKPAYKFYLDQAEDFASATDFSNRKLAAKDSLSSKFQALCLYQDVITFHLKDKDPSILIDWEIARLKFVKDQSILEDKDSRYLAALEALFKKYPKIERSAFIKYHIAEYYKTQGEKYKPSFNGEPLYKWDVKKAYDLCSEAIKAHPDTYGAKLCRVLQLSIERKNHTLTTEQVIPSNQAGLTLVSHKNVAQLFFRAIPLSKAQLDALDRKNNEERLEYLKGLSGAYTWDVELTDDGDFQTHRTEISLPKLKHGIYALLASANKGFTYDDNYITYTTFNVSDLAFLSRNEGDYTAFYITDRTSGQPLKDAKVDFYQNRYNSLLRRYEHVKIGTTSTDSMGYCTNKHLSAKKRYNNSFFIQITLGKDVLYNERSFYSYQESEPRQELVTHFFLDRGIYRPGQTVYFKGLVLDRLSNGKNPKLVPNSTHEIVFYDANYQEVEKLEVTTNDYGSFNGSFTAPTGGLLGYMQINDLTTGHSKGFRVEEYKRPKFMVNALPVEGDFKLDDEVTVKGEAKAYAGNAIDGAKVTYRVVRQAYFPYWNWRWGWYIPFNQETQEIAFGETETDTDGKYSISFKAVPDRSIPKEKQPEFRYTVYATVIDITGETHSTQSMVRLGYVGLDLSLQIPERVDKTNTKGFNLRSTNLNGVFEATQVSVKVERLVTPKVVHKNRFWEKPDYQIIEEEKFKKLFPYYAYKDEDKQLYWSVDREMLSLNLTTEKETKLNFNQVDKWQQGRYKVTLKAKDKAGTPVELVKFFTLYDPNAETTPLNEAIFAAKLQHYSVEPDSIVTFDIGSFAPNAYILYEVEHDQKIIQRFWLQATKRAKIDLPIKEIHRGGIHIHLASIQQGRQYIDGGTVHVPWSNKKLEVSYETFRDKLYPGEKETWRLKIKGPEGNAVAAEVLAGMYDASLDAFAGNNWGLSPHPSSYPRLRLSSQWGFGSVEAYGMGNTWTYPESPNTYRYYPYFASVIKNMTYTYQWMDRPRVYRSAAPTKSAAPQFERKEAKAEEMAEMEMLIEQDAVTGGALLNVAADADQSAPATSNESNTQNSPAPEPEAPEEEDLGDVKIRTNLNETVFFYPDLKTDKEGNVVLEFTMNEALTQWNFLLLGHTKDLKIVSDTRQVVTQKDLMVMPNAPRFFREGDELYFTAKVSNLTEEVMKGQAQLQLFDAISMQPVDAAFGNVERAVSFEAKAGQSAPLVWKIKVPDNWTSAITHRVIAKAGNFSDGEESALPVLTNRMLVTETQPLPVRGKQKKTFQFERMKIASRSNTLQQHKLTLEFTQNPAWYALQSLPYLMEYPYECTEQIFSRYYANSLASNVANSHPKIKRVFDQWRTLEPEALESNLSKNQELKYALLEETPWVLQSQSEAAQKRNIGLLFDLNKMGNELKKAQKKLIDRQLANGGFSWMPGGRDSWYISQYLVEGIGHLRALGVKDFETDEQFASMTRKAVNYTDDELALHYKRLLKAAKRSKDPAAYLAEDHLANIVMHYMYARSFFKEQAINNATTKKALEYYEGQAMKYWNKKSMYMQGFLALGLHRKGKDLETPKKIVKALRENSLNSEEMGMYWKYNTGYFWYQLPIETHALMIEVFDVVAEDAKAVDELKVWLLKAKQTMHWKTTKATAAACYALLSTGDNWLLDDQEIKITLGKEVLDQSKIKKEAGTGYFKTTWEADEIKPSMSTIKVENPNNVVAWGAMYWQYFEQLDKITNFKETPLKIEKELFKQENTDRGPVLKALDKVTLEPGDLLKVRIVIKVDRDMEYVHLKDMRASGFEPTNVLSQYKYQDGLGYYESTRDAATNFFFSYLPKGTYVFEYPLRVNHKGDFSNGVTTIQCMYAPEFTAHSEGIRVSVPK